MNEKFTFVFGEMLIIPLILCICDITNTSPRKNMSFFINFSNSVISYANIIVMGCHTAQGTEL